MTEHDRAAQVSVALHREVARRLRDDPSLVAGALRRVRGWSDGVHEHYRRGWEQLLAGPLDELCALLVEDSERARDLRQTSPFAGVLDAATRWRIWRAARAG
jgi:hypothetical protein